MNYNGGYVEAEMFKLKPEAEEVFRRLVTGDTVTETELGTVHGEIAMRAYETYNEDRGVIRSGAV